MPPKNQAKNTGGKPKRSPPKPIPFNPYNPREPPTSAAQAHWAIQWGEPIPPLNDKLRHLLYDIALILRDIKPNNSDSKSKLFYSRDIFVRSMKLVFRYAGVIVFAGRAQDTPTNNPYSAFIFHPPLIAEVTKCTAHPEGIPDFPSPHDFRMSLMWARLNNTRQFTVQQESKRDEEEREGLEFFDLREALWQACTSVADRIGNRVYRIAKRDDEVKGMGPAGRVLDWLEEDPNRLARLDQLAEDFSRSEQFSELLSSGRILRDGALRHTDMFTLSTVAAKLRLMTTLALKSETEFNIFEASLWQFIEAPLISRALSLRAERGEEFSLTFCRAFPYVMDKKILAAALAVSEMYRDSIEAIGANLQAVRIDRTSHTEFDEEDDRAGPSAGTAILAKRIDRVDAVAMQVIVKLEDAFSQWEAQAKFASHVSCPVTLRSKGNWHLPGVDGPLSVVADKVTLVPGSKQGRLTAKAKAEGKLDSSRMEALRPEDSSSEEEDGEVDQLEETGGGTGIPPAASTSLADKFIVDDDAAEAGSSTDSEYLLNLDGDRDLNRASSSGEGEDEDEDYLELLDDNDDDFDVEIRAEKHDPFPDRDSFPARPGVTEGFATWKQAVEEECEALLKGSTAGPLAFNRLFPVAHGIYNCLVATSTAPISPSARFGRKLFLDNAAAIAVRYTTSNPKGESNSQRIRAENEAVFKATSWRALMRRFSLVLALQQVSERHALFIAFADSVAHQFSARITEYLAAGSTPAQGYAIARATADYIAGMVISSSIGSRQVASSNPHGSSRDWLRALTSPWLGLGYRDFAPDGTTACWHCRGGSCLILPPNDRTPAFYGVDINTRLTVSVHAPRRGYTHRFTRGLDRVQHYPCLVILIVLYYHDTFLVCWLFFAAVIHQRDKVVRHKYLTVLTEVGWRLLDEVAEA